MVDPLAEEQAIIEERSSVPPSLSADVLQQPIERLCIRPVRTLDVSAKVRDALTLMQTERFGSVVITTNKALIGIVTERDILLKVAGKSAGVLDQPITEIMTRQPEWLHKDDAIAYLMNKMHVGGFRHVPIVDDDNVPVYVISLRDVLAYLLDHFPREVMNVPSDPYRGAPQHDSG